MDHFSQKCNKERGDGRRYGKKELPDGEGKQLIPPVIQPLAAGAHVTLNLKSGDGMRRRGIGSKEGEGRFPLCSSAEKVESQAVGDGNHFLLLSPREGAERRKGAGE